MDIDAPKARGGEDGLGQDQAIGGDDRDIGSEGGEFGLFFGTAQARRMAHGQSQRLGPLVQRGLARGLAAPGRARRLGVDAYDLMPRRHDRVERRHGKAGRSHEDDPHPPPMAWCFGKHYLPDVASRELETLAQALARLPGLGPRSARRAVLYLVKRREAALAPLLTALQAVADNLVTCATCGNVDTTNPCAMCADPRRDARLLCVVEEVADLWALDRSRLFPGRYHVLGGRLSALEGIRPEDLSIDRLVGRVSAGGIDEVVLAMNATLEGQTTAHYLAERLEQFPVRLTQLAHGLPVGGELDYLDEGTLAQALRARRPVA